MRIYIVGSLNMDLVIRAPRVPEAGETLSGEGFMTNPGGKGANQAVAVAKLGGEAYMVGCVGREFGRELTDALRGYGVHAGLPVSEDGTLLPPEEATCEQLVYDRRFKDADVLPKGGKCVLYGHTPVRYLTGKDEILFYPRAEGRGRGRNISGYCKIHLDMMTAHSGVAGCVCIDTCRCFYVRDD